MNQLNATNLSLLIALVSFLGVVIGGSITIIGNLLVKRQERLAQISKLIAEKRIEAYEEVIANVRFAALGSGELEAGKFVKQPLVLNELDTYHKWSAEFIMICRRVSHLIDRELDQRLWAFQNYLIYLDELLRQLRDNNGRYSDPDKAKVLGTIVYDDFRELTSDILEEAGRFFNKRIFHSQFTPAQMSNKEYQLPTYFSQLALFSKREEIAKLLKP